MKLPSIEQAFSPELVEQLAQHKGCRIVVGMSGGVDSSLTALLLKHWGFEVIGVFMKNWQEDSPHCTAAEDFKDVERVCQDLEIPYHSMNLTNDYWENVFEDFLEQYKMGATPNPDILCNSEIKFHRFFKKVLSLEARYMATGHYAKVEMKDGVAQLHRGVDSNKDQSYFLYNINSEVLDRVLFPLGNFTKDQVRAMAKEAKIATSEKKDSTGICFIGERKFREFLSTYLKDQQGEIVDERGEVVGEHQGLYYHTIGQRKGLGLGGEGDPWFVYDKDIQSNQLKVVRGHEHPLLFCPHLTISKLNLLVPKDSLAFPVKCTAKIRYRQMDQECTVEQLGEDQFKVVFENSQRGVAIGQSVVFYQEDLCLGGGVIVKRPDPETCN